MALIKFGALIVDTRGSVGGTTFKSTRGGLVMQRKATPTKTVSELTSTNRSRLKTLSQQWWNSLDVSQRDAWRALADANPTTNPWGDELALSGIAFYIRTNITLATIGAAQLLDAPTDQNVSALASLSLSVTAPNIAELAFSASPTPNDHILLINVSPKLSPGINNYHDRFFYLRHGADDETSPLNIGAEWTNQIGNFVTGAQYAVQATLINKTNGARAAPLLRATLAG